MTRLANCLVPAGADQVDIRELEGLEAHTIDDDSLLPGSCPQIIPNVGHHALIPTVADSSTTWIRLHARDRAN